MPIYEYQCRCGQRFEQIVPVGTDGCLCPNCQSKADRVFSLFNFRLYNPFTKDGEGFKTVGMSKDEYQGRWRDRNYDYREVG